MLSAAWQYDMMRLKANAAGSCAGRRGLHAMTWHGTPCLQPPPQLGVASLPVHDSTQVTFQPRPYYLVICKLAVQSPAATTQQVSTHPLGLPCPCWRFFPLRLGRVLLTRPQGCTRPLPP